MRGARPIHQAEEDAGRGRDGGLLHGVEGSRFDGAKIAALSTRTNRFVIPIQKSPDKLAAEKSATMDRNLGRPGSIPILSCTDTPVQQRRSPHRCM